MAATMRALRKTARESSADLVEIPVPEPREGEVLVKVHGASICGTDHHIYDWNEWADTRIPQVPMTFGHEVAGTVVAVGEEVHHLHEGVFIAAETHIACGHWPTCETGRAHSCENLKSLGVDMDGVCGEYVGVPAQTAWIVGDGIDPAVASSSEPCGNAVHASFGTGVDPPATTTALPLQAICEGRNLIQRWQQRSLARPSQIGTTVAIVLLGHAYQWIRGQLESSSTREQRDAIVLLVCRSSYCL